MNSVVSVADNRDLPPTLSGGSLAEINQSLLRRERLLAASARASRLLLEAPDVMAAMPQVLKELGEAAQVDRTAFALAESCSMGEPWLVIKSEWLSENAARERKVLSLNQSKRDCFCSQLKAGHSVHVDHRDTSREAPSIASEFAKSSMIVPFLVDGEYAGAIGFDDCRESRQFDPAVVSALGIAAGVIGAALYREKLIDTVRFERERAAEQRVAELSRTNAAIRSNLERLAGEPDLGNFFGHILLEATRQIDADAGTAIVLGVNGEQWHVVANVCAGELTEPPFPKVIDNHPQVQADVERLGASAMHLEIEQVAALNWPGALDYHREQGHRSVYVQPLVFGDRTVGFMILAFRVHNALGPERAELLVALAQQATLAIGLKRFAVSAKNAAVLAERNRIGQEIHDGLAQAFTGILMQLGAAEELIEDGPLKTTLFRIRDIAKEGLSEARRSVLALKPAETRPGGLELALRQLAERSTVPGRVISTFEGGGTPTGLPPEYEHELLRIAQEAVINAVRHGQPRNIAIALASETDFLRLSIVDDGCGMADLPELYAQQGFGLTNMRERAQAIGGAWKVESKPREGTRISVWIPRSVSA